MSRPTGKNEMVAPAQLPWMTVYATVGVSVDVAVGVTDVVGLVVVARVLEVGAAVVVVVVRVALVAHTTAARLPSTGSVSRC